MWNVRGQGPEQDNEMPSAAGGPIGRPMPGGIAPPPPGPYGGGMPMPGPQGGGPPPGTPLQPPQEGGGMPMGGQPGMQRPGMWQALAARMAQMRGGGMGHGMPGQGHYR